MTEQDPKFGEADYGRHRLTETPEGQFVTRLVRTRVLGEYGDGESFGSNALQHLGIDEQLPLGDQLLELADISERELSSITTEYLAIVPYERDQDEDGTLTYYADVVYPSAANQDPAQHLAYVPIVIDYLEAKFGSFERLTSGEIEKPEPFHADLALPGQYVYGSTDKGPIEKLYMVDLDPGAAPVATMVDGKWQLSYVLTT